MINLLSQLFQDLKMIKIKKNKYEDLLNEFHLQLDLLELFLLINIIIL